MYDNYELDKMYRSLLDVHDVTRDTKVYKRQLYLQMLQDRVGDLGSEKTIAFYGCNRSAVEMFYCLPRSKRTQVRYLVQDRGSDIDISMPCPVLKANEIGANRTDVIFLTERSLKEEMLNCLQNQHDTALPQIVDIYADLDARGYTINNAVYATEDNWCVVHQYISQLREQYERAEAGRKPQLLQELISDFLLIYDMPNSFYYIDLYIANEWSGYQRYLRLKEDLTNFFINVRNKLSSRKSKAHICFLFDGMPQEAVQYMPCLQEKQNNFLSFSNCYPSGSFTKSSNFTFISQQPYLDSGLFAKEKIDFADSALMQSLKDEGIHFKVLSPFQWLDRLNEFDIGVCPGDTQTTMQWITLCDLYEYAEDSFYLLNIMEAHPPYFNSSLKASNINYSQSFDELIQQRAVQENERIQWFEDEKQLERAAWQYCDSQAFWFINSFGDFADSVTIMSDHGHHPKRDKMLPRSDTINRERQKCVLMVKSPSLIPQRTDALYSLKELGTLWLYAFGVRKGQYTIPEFQYVCMEREPSYGRELQAQNGVFTALPTHASTGGYTILNDEEEYILNLDGYEMYRVHSQRENSIHCQSYQTQIAHCRQLVHADFAKIWRLFFNAYPHTKVFFKELLDEDLYQYAAGENEEKEVR